MGVFLQLLDQARAGSEIGIPKGRQASKESYKRHQRHRHGENNDGACERHDERERAVLDRMRRIVRVEDCRYAMLCKLHLKHVATCYACM
jgi:hypothetical protein